MEPDSMEVEDNDACHPGIWWPSQKSSYSDLPDDISELIRLAPSQSLSHHSNYSDDLEDISALILEAPVGTQWNKSINDSGSSKSSLVRSGNSSESCVKSCASSTSLFSRTDSEQSMRAAESSNSAADVEPIPQTDERLGKRKERDFGESSPSTTGPGKRFKSARLSLTDEDEGYPPIFISYAPAEQRLFKSLDLPYAVQYEIARMAATMPDASLPTAGYKALNRAKLMDLRGRDISLVAPVIPELFGKLENSTVDDVFSKEIAAKAPWGELDLENKNLAINPLSGLGLSKEAPDWFGGKVHFTGKIIKGSPFKIVLKPPELGPSDRFARRWGSGRFLTLSVSNELLREGEKVINFLYRPVVIGGCVFRAFDAKDGNVFFVCTNEIVEGMRIHPTRVIPGLLSLRDFLAWHNALELNPKQTMAKWASRFALGRSNSAPVLRLEVESINETADILSESGSDMTDGAGLINKAGLRRVFHRFEMDTWPTAIQCRVAGAKGLLVMDPTDVHEEARIWIRPSQIKVKHTNNSICEDPTLRTIDLLRTAHCRTSSRLSVETIINLAENGVPFSSFLKLVEEAMVNLVTPLLTWDGPDAMQALWCAVARVGGVMSSRLARKETVLSRVKGYSERDSGDIDNGDEEVDDQPSSTAWWVDQISGCPSTLEETILYLLDSGFHPETCSVLRDKLKKVVEGCISRYIESYRIDLPVGMSATAFLVPDQFGVLEYGEFFFKSSHHDFQMRDGLPTDVLLGPALITRHPCKLPTDVQKWTAVDKPELRHLTDVIVLSVKGPRRSADFLSGGDYDGDKGLVIWQPELVDPFVNAELHYSEEPPEVAKCFSPKNETVENFLVRTGSMSAEQQLREMQSCLLSAIRDTAVVGKYSNWHLNATYTLGYGHPETIRLAYMFNKTLDGAKTGLTVLPEVYKEDAKKYDKRPPAWKETTEKTKVQYGQSNMVNVRRRSGLGHFVMDKLHALTQRKWETTTEWGKKLKAERNKFTELPHVVDEDLTAPWLAFAAKEKARKDAHNLQQTQIALLARSLDTDGLPAEVKEAASQLLAEASYKSDAELIQKHIEDVCAKHKKKIDANFTKLPIERRQDILRELSRDFAAGPEGLSMDAEEAARIKASYVYWYDSDKRRNDKWVKWSRFPWDVAFRELCLIRTRSSKVVTLKPVNSDFYERMTMKMARARV